MVRELEPIDRERRSIDFGRVAVDYERYRPGFPDEFFDRLSSVGWISPGLRALDVGAGTGTLALGFAARGMVATGLDIAEELLAVARRHATDSGLANMLAREFPGTLTVPHRIFATSGRKP